MKFFEIIQSNKLFVHYLTIVIVIVGFMSLSQMQREARPNVNFNRVAISVGYPGASPADIEELVIDPIEEKISEVDGIEEYRSVAFSGAGAISIQIDDEYANPSEAVDEIRRKIAEVKDLPDEVNDPVISEIKAVNRPVLRLAIYGELSPFDMKLEVEKLKDFLKNVRGVQSVDYTGLEDLQLKVLTNPSKLNSFDITLVEIMSRLQSWSQQRPGGLLENSSQTVNLTIGENYNEVDKLENFIVRSNDSGRNVRLSDLATVEYDTENTQVSSSFAGESAVLLTIVKKPFSDAVSTVDLVKEKLVDYRKNLDTRLKYKFYTDDSERVRNRMQIVVSNAVFGLILVLFILMILLDWRSALVTSVGIPVAILGGVFFIYYLGNTLNSLTIVGMIIVLGMLVDDAIVVTENIYAHIEKGLDPIKASLVGVKEIAIPVVATVLTTVFSFFPILFMQEIMGQFLRVIPAAVICLLLLSLFEALVILPVHCAELLKPVKKKASLFDKITDHYERYLKWTIRNKYIVLAVIVVIFGGSMIQGKQLFNRFTLFPAEGLEGLSVRLEVPKNTPLAKTEDTINALSKRLIAVSDSSFESIYANVGSVRTGGAGGSQQNGSHLGMITVIFTSAAWWPSKEKEVVSNIRKVAREFSSENNVKTSITLDRPGPPIGKPIQLQVTSRDLEFGREIVDQIKAELNKINGVYGLETDLDGDVLKYRFLVNNDLAVSEGVDPNDISQTIFAATTGRVTSEILKNSEKVEILVGVSGKAQEIDIERILSLRVRNNSGRATPIRTYVKVIEEKGPSSIQRLNGLRTITLFGEVNEKTISGKEANQKIRPFVTKLQADNPSITIEAGGGERDRMRALADTMRLYLLAIVLIFMTISLSFRSLTYPFFVLLTIPMGLCGVVWALTLHGKGMTLMGLVGIVGLSGVVVNVSIILLKFLQERLAEGMDFEDALIAAGSRRLRPIVITTITTLIGLMPTIYGVGGTDHFVQPIALVLGWGIFMASLLTIFALPALVAIVPRFMWRW